MARWLCEITECTIQRWDCMMHLNPWQGSPNQTHLKTEAINNCIHLCRPICIDYWKLNIGKTEINLIGWLFGDGIFWLYISSLTCLRSLLRVASMRRINPIRRRLFIKKPVNHKYLLAVNANEHNRKSMKSVWTHSAYGLAEECMLGTWAITLWRLKKNNDHKHDCQPGPSLRPLVLKHE